MFGKKKLAAAAIAFTLSMQAVPAMAKSYTVGDNDTFYLISQRYNVDLQLLMNANPNIDPLNIYKGLKIEIPTNDKEVRIQSTPVAEQADEGKASGESAPKMEAKAATASTLKAANVIQTNGQQLTYKKKLEVKATAYTSAASENGKWGAVDYFGNPLKVGTVAVDPDMIPLGAKVYVTGYDFDGLPVGGFVGKATDIGGAINGNRIDIFVPTGQSKAKSFGIQNVTIYILE